MKRFEEIKKLHEHFACGHEEIDDLIQMVNLLIKRNSVEVGSIKKLVIVFKDNMRMQIKTERIIERNNHIECYDKIRMAWVTINLNEVLYYTMEEGEENV